MLGLLDREICAALVMTFAHFIWQGSLIAGLAVFATRMFRTPHRRYLVLVHAFLLMTTSPVITFLIQPSPNSLEAGRSTHPRASRLAPASDGKRIISSTPQRLLSAPDFPQRPLSSGTVSPKMNQDAGPFGTAQMDFDWKRLAPFLTQVYLFGVVLMLIRLSIGLWGGRRLRLLSVPIEDGTLASTFRRHAERLELTWVPVLAYSVHVSVPTVIGVLKPTILLPFAIASGLSPAQLEAVLAHELAHLRRYDHLVNLWQRVAESLLFFHPAVWWISQRIRSERELCCDDLVVACGVIPLDYATTLLRVAELSRTSPADRSLSAVSLLGSGRPSLLRARIARLLSDEVDCPVRLQHRWPILVMLLACTVISWSTMRAGGNTSTSQPVVDSAAGPRLLSPLPKVPPGNTTMETTGQPDPRPSTGTFQSVTSLQKSLAANIPEVAWGHVVNGLRMAWVPRAEDTTEWGSLPKETQIPTTLQISAGDQIVSQLVLHNTSDHPIYLTGYTSSEIHRSLVVQDSQQRLLPVQSNMLSIPENPSSCRMLPGEKYLLQMPTIHFVKQSSSESRIGFIVPVVAGTYTIRCHCRFGLRLDKNDLGPVADSTEWTGTLESGSIACTIDDPEPAKNWGQINHGLRARIIPVSATMDEDKIDITDALTRFRTASDLAFVVELENTTNKQIQLLDTRYGESYGNSKGKANSNWLGQYLFSVDYFDSTGKKLERPLLQVVDANMILEGALLATLEPQQIHRCLLRPSAWLSIMSQPLSKGSYTAQVRYHGLPSHVAERIKEYRPASKNLAAVPGDIVSSVAAFDIQEDDGNIRSDNSLVWGQPSDGLRSAVELIPRQAAYPHGTKPKLRLHVQNVSQNAIILATHLWLNDLAATIKDGKGAVVNLDSIFYSGWTMTGRCTLQPGQTIVIDSGNLGIASSKQQADEFGHVTNRKLVTPEGNYRIQLTEPVGQTFLLKDGKGKQLAPLPGDWKGTLKTAETPFVIGPLPIAKPPEIKQDDKASAAADQRNLLKKVQPSVVTITTQKNTVVNGQTHVVKGLALGTIVDTRGYILTCDFTLSDTDAEATRVRLADGSEHPATLVKSDPDQGLALLHLKTTTVLQATEWGLALDLKPGHSVLALTPVFEMASSKVKELTIVKGVIRDLHRELDLEPRSAYQNLIQADISVFPSGGPLMSETGEVLGLCMAIRVGRQRTCFARQAGDLIPFLQQSLPPRT